jgi:hypothetical protein
MIRFLPPLLLVTVVASLTMSACSSKPDIDPRELELTRTAILEAKQVDAERHAAQALRVAEERLALARDRIDAGREDEAMRMLHEARVLAELAEAESLAQQTTQAAQAIQQSLSNLQKDVDVDAAETE